MTPTSIVVIGASLGGLHAINSLLAVLPPDFATPMAIVQHRRADSSSALTDLLAARAKVPLIEPDDHTEIESGHIYLAPADYHLLVERGALALSIDEPVNFSRPSIDVLFETAARAYGSSTTGVLLTGSSEDGARGLLAIAEAGGFTIVQDPEEAESPVAPQAALRMGEVDEILTLAAIGELLVRRDREASGDLHGDVTPA